MKFCDPSILGRWRHLRNSLLRFRFERSGSVQPLVGECPPNFSPRAWDMLRVFAGPFVGDEEACAELRGLRIFHGFGVFPCEREPQWLSPRRQATLSALSLRAHEQYAKEPCLYEDERRDSALVGELTEIANRVLEGMGEITRLSPRELGAQLDNLGFPKRRRGYTGYEFDFTKNALEQIHRLAKYYGVWEVDLCHHQQRSRCEWCRRLKLVTDADIRWYEEELKPAMERQQEEQVVRSRKRIAWLKKHRPSLARNRHNNAARGVGRPEEREKGVGQT